MEKGKNIVVISTYATRQ